MAKHSAATAHAPASLGQLLARLRKECGLSQQQVAKRLHISAPRLSQWEHDRRRPAKELAGRLASALELSGPAQQELLAAMGAVWQQRLKLQGRSQQLVEQISLHLAADDVSVEHRKKLVDSLARSLQQWQLQRTQQVSSIVVPVAGWQADLLSDEQSARLVRAVVHEARSAPLRKLIVVAAPRQRVRLVQRLKGDHRLESLRIMEVIQERPDGLGAAIRLTQSALEDGESFLLSFPDERVPADYTNLLLAAHLRTQRNLIAVRKRPAAGRADADAGNLGGVVLDAESDGDLLRVRRLAEKPTPQASKNASYSILGRYVLIAGEVFPALRELPPNQRTKKVELTDALDQLARDGEVLGLPYQARKGQLRSLRVPRQLMGKALDEFLAPIES
jgi:UTP-glucose-1-phosphate uridylyltransferase/transcriptional regulator with XRE-family HTH domain